MRLDFLKEVLAVTTVTEEEDNMADFIMAFGIKHGITAIKDSYGNVYLKKGKLDEGEHYPVVVSHMDTVHGNQRHLIKDNIKLNIHEDKLDDGRGILYATDPVTEKITGIGGDDKAGIAICLSVILKTDKIIGAFFKEEESGCWGSKHLDKGILKDAGYVIQFDAPGDNWISYNCWGTQLFNREFYLELEDLFTKYNVDNFSDDPYTDVYQMRQQLGINTINIFAGYEGMHTRNEFIINDNVQKSMDLGMDMLEKLGRKKYEFLYKEGVITQPLREVIHGKEII